ncbi:MAG: retroviral-like aspartic protease family protein [Candidatus Phlomobacter fragariae]
MTIYKKVTLTVFSLAIFTSFLSGCSLKKTEKLNEIDNNVLNEKFNSFLVVPVTIHNKTYHFLVDTGSSITVINEKIAKEITQEIPFSMLHPLHKEVFSNFKTIHGKIEAKHVKFFKPITLFINNKEISNNDIIISLSMDFNLLTQANGINIDGILGIDTFRRFHWQVDNDNKIITISGTSFPISNYSYCIGYSDKYNGSPILNLDYGTNDTIKMDIDTGALITYMDKKFIEYIKKQKENLMPIKNSGSSIEATGHIKNKDYILTGLTFNNHPLGEIRISENNNHQYGVGMNFLSRFNRYAFMPSKMLFCYDTTSLYKENQYPVRNIGVRYYDKHIEISYNKQNNIDKYHLKKGDVIIKINDVVYPPQKIEKVREILSQTPKGQLTLIIKRLGVKQKIVI